MNRTMHVNLLFQADTTAAMSNIQTLSNLLHQISSTTMIGVDGGSLQQAVAAAQQLQIHLSNAVNVDTGKLDLIKLNSSLKTAGTNLQTLTSNLTAAGTMGQQAFARIAMAVAQAEAPIIRVGGSLKAFATTLANTAKWQIASTAIHGIASMMSSAVTHAEDLNRALNDIRIVTGYSKNMMAEFAAEARDAATALSSTTTEYAKASLIFYQQGLSGEEVTERADTVIKLSQVTGQSAEVVSDQMTAIWNNFADGSQKLEYYADALTKLGAATAASTDEISEGLEKFAAVADTVGLSYEYATAAVATVIDKTRQSADVVGTAFKTIFARVEGLKLGETLEDGVDLNKYSEALAAVGVNILDASGQLRTMDEILNDLGSRWNTFGQETKVALAQTVGGLRQYNQMLALMENWDSVIDNVELASKATGELADQQYIWSQSYEAAAQRTKQAKNELYEKFIDDESVVALQDVFTSLVESVSRVIDAMGGVGPMLLMIGGLLSSFLMPVIARGFTFIVNGINNITGKSAADIANMQNVIKVGMMDMMSTLSTPLQQQIILSKDLITLKQRLTEATKTMSAAEAEEAQRRMQVYEAMVAEAQSSLEMQEQLRKEIELNEQALLSGENKAALLRGSAAHQLMQQNPGMKEDEARGIAEDAQNMRASEAQAGLAAAQNTVAQNAAKHAAAQTALTDQFTAPGSTMTEEEYNKQLAKLKEVEAAEQAQVKRYQDIIALQKLMQKESRLTAEELKKMSVGAVDAMPDVRDDNMSGVEKAKSKGNYISTDEKTGKKTVDRDVRTATAQDMVDKVQATGDDGIGLQMADDGGVQASVANLETLLVKTGEYKAQAQELALMAQDVGTGFMTQSDAVLKAAGSLPEYQLKMSEVTTAEQLRDQALADLIKAQEEAAASGKKDAATKGKLKELATELAKAEQNLILKQKEASKTLTGLDKDGKKYVQQLSSIRTALEKAARSSKNADKELKEIADVFDRLNKGDTSALKDLEAMTLRLSQGSDEAAEGVEGLANSIANKLMGSGMNPQQMEAFITNLEKMGIISPEVANKIRELANAGQDMGNKLSAGGQRAVSTFQGIATASSQIMMAISAIKNLWSAVSEGQGPLDITIAALSTMTMLLPLLIGLLKLTTNAKKMDTAITVVSTAANKLNTESEKKSIIVKGLAKVATIALAVAEAILNAIRQHGVVAGLIIAAVAVAAIAGLVAWTSATQENTEAQIENQEAAAENAAKMSEAIDETQKLAKEVSNLTEEYEKLSAAGKNTAEVLDSMNEKIPDLIKHYRDLAKNMNRTDEATLNSLTDELEDLYRVAQLTGDYSEFEKKKKEIDDSIVEAEYENAIYGAQNAGAVGANAMVEASDTGSVTGKVTNIKLAGSEASWGAGNFFGGGASSNSDTNGNGIPDGLDEEMKNNKDDLAAEETIAKGIMAKNLGSYYKQGHGAGMFARSTAHIEFDHTNAGEFVEAYEGMQASLREMEETMTKTQLENSGVYQNLKDAVKAGKEQYDQMVPLAKAQAESGGEMARLLMEQGKDAFKYTDANGKEQTMNIAAQSMENIDTMEEYLSYRQQFLIVAKEQFGLTESQADAYLKEADALKKISGEAQLASAMLKNMHGLSEEQVKNLMLNPAKFADYSNTLKAALTDAFGELSDQEMAMAASIAATATSMSDFVDKMTRALISSARQEYEVGAQIAGEVLAESVKAGDLDMSKLLEDDTFLAYLEDINMQATELTAKTYEEQYAIVSAYYAKVKQLAFETYDDEADLLMVQMARKQEALANWHALQAGLRKEAGLTKEQAEADQKAYAAKKKELEQETDAEEKFKIQGDLDKMELDFETKYGFEIESNAAEMQNEIDALLDSLDELQDKKIQLALDWTGTDAIETGMQQAGKFAKFIENDTKRVGNRYVMTAAQAKEWLKFYPELGKMCEETTGDMIELNAAQVDEFIAGQDTSLDKAIQVQIDELKAKKAALEKDLELKDAELQAAELLAQGEMSLKDVSSQYLVQLRSNLVKYYIDAGYDEAAANKAALDAMGMDEAKYQAEVARLAKEGVEKQVDMNEAGANAQKDTLEQLRQRYANMADFLVNNLGTVLYDIGCAMLDPSYAVGDVFRGYWDNTAIISDPNFTPTEGPEYNTGEFSLDKHDITAAFQGVYEKQIESVREQMRKLQEGIHGIDGQIAYLEALKNQDLSEFGNTDPSKDSSDDNDKEEKDLVEIAERYHEITREVEALERATDRLGDQADRAYGTERLKLMNEQAKALKNQYERQKDLLEMQKAFLVSDLENIKGNFEIEPVIDGDGNLSNYTALLQSAADKLNEARTAFNNSAQEEADQEALDAAEEAYEKQIELLEQYEETLDELNDQVDTVTESFYELQDLKFDELNYALELKIEVNDSDLARIDYYMAKMEEDFYQMAEAAALLAGSTANMGSSGSIGVNLSSLTAQQDYLQSIKEAYAKNEISQDAYIQGLKDGRDAIYENLTALQELDATMMDYYGNTLAMAGEEIAKYTTLIENSANALSYYSSIAALMGKETDYKYMGTILKGQADIAKNSYDVSKAQYDMLKTSADQRKAAYDAAVANGAGQEELEMLEKQWWDAQNAVAEAQDTMLANAEAWGSALRAVLDNSLADLGKELENALAEGFGSFDAMNTAFERKNALQEEYLTTTNKIYETNKMMRTAQSEIDKSTNAAAKRKLKQFIGETAALQDQTKLSQYELDIQQAKYNLLLAELALEEQQNAKSTVRLQRDNEGNFSYVYTANADKVAEAQQKFDDAQNALYNKGLEGANGYTEKYQQTMQEMYDTLTNLQTQYLEGAFESEEEYQNAIADAKQYYYEKLENYSRLYSIALSTDSQVAADAWTTEFAAMTQETGKWMNSVNEYLTGTEKAFADFNGALSTIKNDVVGTNLEEMAENTKAIVDYSNQLAQEVTKEGGVIDALTNEISAVEDITEAYASFRDTLKEIETQYENIAADADAAAKAAAGLPGVTTGQPGDGNTNEQAPGTTPTSDRDVSNLDWARVKAAYDKIANGDWGSGEEIASSGENAGYTAEEIDTAKELAELVAGGETVESAKTILGFDTGGYTGDWAGSYGKLAFLHKKELVLHPEDTSNFLASMEILERILQILDLQAVSAQLGGMLTSPTLAHQNDGVLEQNVHIEASFPGVQDHNEVELAISNLINTASQFANRK